ncbi:2-amino-4-hydroxy-6-hydroxymethyldihydropteridine diphosphokinase [Niabella soli]|uniref:2-amino-4-hydroxy-6-hydroxymethyldihydropteridine pyrophosphokinase n=1 Tax=Niabella soli DSM 19437 TaxID=929713 RepID=W0F5A2_9BACT|nr:2-amino-4-hydroxy-6-hydroxymethyldihydropteridine diphosphokinase [Niabella soli]AHF16993.1 2-amino-4-hydroxy-6-hydroxymethyldihydropteridine pyrophosphokinase [Niabella soli DSM 19437]
MNPAYLLIGGNLGNRQENLGRARRHIEKEAGAIIKRSAIYETAAWGLTDQPDFYNQALRIETTLTPEQLMTVILKIETTMGRIRQERYGPRIIDIDILFYGAIVCDTPAVTIPHPRITERRFVLAPLEEIAPDLIHPQLNKSIHELLAATTDTSPVKKVTNS